MVSASQITMILDPARARFTRNAMPPMWAVPLRAMVSSRRPVEPMGLRQRTRGPSVVSGSGDGPAGAMEPVSWRSRDAWAISVASQACCGVMRPGRPWWRALGVAGCGRSGRPAPGAQ